MTCNNVILAQPQAESNVSYTIPEGDSARLNFTPEEISGLSIGDNGQLVISFEDGGQLTITNFQDLADSGNLIYMANGTLIDPSILTSSSQAPSAFNNAETALASQTDATIITQPQANTTQEVSMQAGQKYVCDFDPANAATVEIKDGAMILTFADGSQVVINNYEQATAGDLPAELTVSDGTVVETENLITEATEVESIEEILQVAQTEDAGEEIANIEPAAGDEAVEDADLAALAESLADIETAAGESGGAGGNSGYGFNSKPVEVPLDSPDAIGPLGPTKLRYEAPEVDPGNPIVEEVLLDADDIPTISFDEKAVDETNFSSGSLLGTGTIVATYGNDVPGAISPSNNFQIVSPFGLTQLMSGGDPVVVTTTSNGYIATVNSDTVFTFEIDPVTGDYTYEQFLPVDHPDATDPDDVISIDLGLQAEDLDGDKSFSSVRVHIADDGPVAYDDTVALANNQNTANGNVLTNDDKGEDDGVGVAVTTPGTYNGTFGTLVLNTDGTYTYTRNGQQGGVDTFDYTMRDHDGDTSSAILTIDVTDDFSPVDISGVGATDDTYLVFGPDVENGVINVDYQGDGPGTTTGDGNFLSNGQQTNGALSHNGVAVNVSFDANTNTYTGTAGTTTVFTMVIHDDATYTFTQLEQLDHSNVNDDNEALFLHFGVTATDSDGDTGTGSVRITVRDDGPVAYDDTVALANNQNTANGNVLTNDDKGEDDGVGVAVTTPGTYNGTFGTLVLNTDGTYTYTRNGQQGGVDTFDYTMRDHDGDTSSAILTIDVADDLSPIDISGAGETDDTNLAFGPDVENGAINVDYQGDGPGTTTGSGSFTSDGQQTNGTLSHNGVAVDVSFDANTNTYTGTAGTTTVFTMVIHDDATYTFTQLEQLDHSNVNDDNEALFLNFGVTATDSDGDTGDGTVRITVRDDAPEAHDDKAFVNSTTTSEEHQLDPTHDDVCDVETTLTRDGITVSSNNGRDLTWVSNSDGSGLGIAGNGSSKVYGSNEQLEVSFASSVTAAIITLADMGSNNIGDSFAYKVYLADGSTINETITIDGSMVVVGMIEFEVDGYASNITAVDLIGGPSFVLNNVRTETVDTSSTNAEGNVLANDDLSQDDDTTVTSVNFEGTDYVVPANGQTVVQGNNGTLTIHSNGQYSYTATNGGTTTSTQTLSAVSSDVAGTQSSFTRDGITVSSNNGQDLSWFSDPSLGSGIGITGGSKKVYGSSESLEVDFAAGVDQATFSIGDMGSNNVGNTFKYTVRLADGSSINETVTIDANKVTNGVFDFEVSGYNSDIVGVDLVGGPSYVLNNVHAGTTTVVDGGDTFIYTITDADGDTSTASLDICVDGHDSSLALTDVGAVGIFLNADMPDDLVVSDLEVAKDEVLFNAIGESTETLLALDAAGEDVLDISQMLETNDDVTEAIQDFVHNQEQGAPETHINDNDSTTDTSEVSIPSVNELDQLPQALNDQIIV